MFIKLIICDVKKNRVNEFSIAQEKWEKTSDSKGFIMQAGGWDLRHANTACIISFWETKNALLSFMENLHDEIFEAADQVQTYKSIAANYFNKIMFMEGESRPENYVEKGRLLRIADCCVKPDRVKHFEEAQKKIWLPGMRKSKGMIGGIFLKN